MTTPDSEPTVRSIAADDEHGAATLSIRALEVLYNRAQLLLDERDDTGPEPVDEWDELASLARRLLEARPSMAVLRNRVNRAMASVETRDAAAVLESTQTEIDRAREADERAAANASTHAGGTVLTLSRSATVREAIRAGSPDRVFIAESRPACEGVDVAEDIAEDVPVTVHTDAAMAHLLAREPIDHVLVGADTILADGRVVNKIGTRAAAITAAHESIPVFAVAASDKITSHEVNLESGSRAAVYDGDAAIDVVNPTFDITPTACLSGVVTERGILSPAEIDTVATELATLESWREP